MLKPFIASLSLACAATPIQAGTTERFGYLSIDTAIDIPAPAEAVWQVLADLGAYADWNPYHVRVEGEARQGARLTVHVQKPNGDEVTLRPYMIEANPGQNLVWGGRPAWIFRGVHRFDLETLAPGCTRLRHSEVFSGLFVSFADLEAIEPGYALMNRALRDRVVALHGAGQAC